MRSFACFTSMLIALATIVTGCSDPESPARGIPSRALRYDGGPLPDAAGVIGDLPCDVADIVVRHCITCHGVSPAVDAHSLLSTADFAGPSVGDPSRTMAAMALDRIRLTNGDRMPPPPAVPVSSTEIDAFAAWVASGMPQGSCAIDDPFDVPPQCTSMRTWTGGNRESPNMRPGGACIDCHVTMREGPRYSLAGTVFPTAHEPDDCNGAAATDTSTGVYIEVFDAAGRTVRLVPNSVGNFGTSTTITFPITARITSSNGTYEMTTPSDSGDCNTCHTQDGTEDAPGRIVIP